MAAGRDLLAGKYPKEPLRVWFLSGEETQNEIDVRVAATCQHHNIGRADCGDRLFVQSVRNKPRFATLDKNRRAILNKPALDDLEAEIKAKKLDVVMIDPLVSFHSITESSNEDIDLLIKEGLGAIAERTNCHIEVYHHPGKPKPGQTENTVEDARGASALIWAVRSARVFN
jgi:RecA-family ATPase